MLLMNAARATSARVGSSCWAAFCIPRCADPKCDLGASQRSAASKLDLLADALDTHSQVSTDVDSDSRPSSPRWASEADSCERGISGCEAICESVEDVVTFVNTAWRVGRVLEAQEVLNEMQDATALSDCPSLTQGVLAKIRRVTERYRRCAQRAPMPDPHSGWTIESVDKDLEYGFNCGEERAQFMMTATFQGYDVLLAAAAILEFDLSSGLSASISSTTNLGDAADIVESLWHVERKGILSGRLEETLLQVSVVDALSEPDECIAVLVETAEPGENGKDVNGVPVPLPQPGVKRALPGRCCFSLSPHGSDGFKMHEGQCTKQSSSGDDASFCIQDASTESRSGGPRVLQRTPYVEHLANSACPRTSLRFLRARAPAS